ncbi:MAG TPA: hypothetical protein VE547_20375 [Mycobacteriales bacterium]|jgi:hypothetical protein|nr:hypothetical protein [Mycobacteriales bacterium]
MSVRTRLAAAPWPVWSLVGVLFWLAWGWPFLLVRAGYWVHILTWGAVGLPVSIAVGRWQDRKRTGWDHARQRELIRAARKGSLPADPADLRRLRALVAKEVANGRGMRWLGPILAALLTGALLLVFLFQDLAAVWLAIGVLWYAVLATAAWRLTERMQAEQRRVLAALDAAGVDGSAGG